MKRQCGNGRCPIPAEVTGKISWIDLDNIFRNMEFCNGVIHPFRFSFVYLMSINIKTEISIWEVLFWIKDIRFLLAPHIKIL